MGIVIKQSIRSSIFAYLGVGIGFLNVLFLYTYFLSAEQVGLFRIIQSASFLFATFGQFGIGQCVVKFYPELKKEKGLLGASTLFSILSFLFLVSIILVFQEQIKNYFLAESAIFIEYLELTILITFFLIQFQVFEAYCRSILNIIIPTFLRDVLLRLLITLLICLYGFELINFRQAIYLLVTAYAINAITLLFYLTSIQKLPFTLNVSFLKNGKWSKYLKYAFFSLLGAGGTQIVLQIDSIRVGGSEGLEATGIYTIAFFIGVVIEIPKRAITQISSALLSKSIQMNDMEAVDKLYKQTSINQLIVGTLLLIGIWSNLENIYAFIPNNEVYKTGMSVVLFIALGKLSDMAFGTNGEIIVLSRYYKFNVVAILLLAVLTIVLNAILIPIYGIEGAAIASFIAMLSFNLVKYLFVWLKFKLQPFTIHTIKFALLISIVLLVERFIPTFELPILDLIIRSTSLTILIIVPTLLLNVSPELNGLYHQLKSRVFSK